MLTITYGVPLIVTVTSARRSGVVMVVGAGTACSLIAGVAVADPEDRDTLRICFSPQALSLP